MSQSKVRSTDRQTVIIDCESVQGTFYWQTDSKRLILVCIIPWFECTFWHSQNYEKSSPSLSIIIPFSFSIFYILVLWLFIICICWLQSYIFHFLALVIIHHFSHVGPYFYLLWPFHYSSLATYSSTFWQLSLYSHFTILGPSFLYILTPYSFFLAPTVSYFIIYVSTNCTFSLFWHQILTIFNISAITYWIDIGLLSVELAPFYMILSPNTTMCFLSMWNKSVFLTLVLHILSHFGQGDNLLEW